MRRPAASARLRLLSSIFRSATGLVADTSREGFRRACAPRLRTGSLSVGSSEAGWAGGCRRCVLATLAFFAASRQESDVRASGYRGFYYHFLDMRSGERAWRSELSTIDTALLLAGALAAAAYFSGSGAQEREIRSLAAFLYERADWNWALNGGDTVTMGWRPPGRFLKHRWRGYSEALLLYVLALGSPTRPIMPQNYDAYTAAHEWLTLAGWRISTPARSSSTCFRRPGSIFAAFATGDA